MQETKTITKSQKENLEKFENQKKICKRPIEMHKNENKYLPKICDSYVLACSIIYTTRKENVLKNIHRDQMLASTWNTYSYLPHFFFILCDYGNVNLSCSKHFCTMERE